MSLRDELERIGVDDPDRALAGIRAYGELLRKWNRRINLVGRTVPDELEDIHAADALAVVEHLPADARRVVDVGSGGGLPSVLVATLRPDLEIVALEPVRKKHAFLATARRELGLTGFEPLPGRDDEYRERPDFEPHDAAVSRATFELPEWLERGRLLVRPGGVVLGLEGARQHLLPDGATRHGYRAGDRTRSIVVMGVAGGR